VARDSNKLDPLAEIKCSICSCNFGTAECAPEDLGGLSHLNCGMEEDERRSSPVEPEGRSVVAYWNPQIFGPLTDQV
jgi:hypothetical protein